MGIVQSLWLLCLSLKTYLLVQPSLCWVQLVGTVLALAPPLMVLWTDFVAVVAVVAVADVYVVVVVPVLALFVE